MWLTIDEDEIFGDIGDNLMTRQLQWNNNFDPSNPLSSSSSYVTSSKTCNEDCLNESGNYFCRDFFKYDKGLCCVNGDPLCRQEYDFCSE